jgi:peptidoglycan hydrolase-like protein with peptidoglycan-binding domain
LSRRRISVVVVALFAALAAIPVSDAVAKRSFGSRGLHRPMRGADVRELQRLLTAWGLPLEADGVFGRHTKLRVRSWERNSGRRINGRVTRREQRALALAVERGEHLPGWTPEPAPAPAAPPTGAATLNPDGTATAPADAPQEVKDIIAAGNKIHDLPYKYGGGHGKWNDTGYDCSGSISYVLHAAGLLDTSMDSTGFMSWGKRWKGNWVTTFANPSHAYMVVAGLRFDTSGRAADGSRWHDTMRSKSGYTVRHPAGL